MEVECAAEVANTVLGEEAGQEFDDELFDPGRSNVSVNGRRWGPAIASNGVLDVEAVDGRLDSESATPPSDSVVAGAGERPGLRIGPGDSKDVEGVVQRGQVPLGQINRVFGGWVKRTATDPLF